METFNEILPATHTEVEYKAIPTGYIHLVKPGGTPIHKKPAAFLDRTEKIKKFKKVFNEDTGEDDVTMTVKTVKREPAVTLKQYAKAGYQRCNRDGSVILNMDGSPKEPPKTKG